MTTKQLGFSSLPQVAIAQGASTPDPGIAGVVVWSTTLSAEVVWTGAIWTRKTPGTIQGVPITGGSNVDVISVGAAPPGSPVLNQLWIQT